MLTLKRQICRIYAITALGSLQLAGACWAALLAARGFSLTQIGWAEAVFHLTSLLFEVPSGVIADVFGRKRCMIASQCMSAMASVAMMGSGSIRGVCVAMALSALGYNFASGAREALAYESLKQYGQQGTYERFAVNDTTIWRIGTALSTLCAGAALWIGPRAAYGVDLTLALLGLWPAMQLQEPPKGKPESGSVILRIRVAVKESVGFVVHSPRVLRLMFGNALVGSVATMLLYLLQARLPVMEIPAGWLGPVLFLLGLSGTLGLQITRFTDKLRYRLVVVLCGTGVLIGTLLAATSWLPAVLVGGFLAGTLDDLMDVCINVILNEIIPSSRRATLVSVSSLVFSFVMLAIAPLLGALFSMV